MTPDEADQVLATMCAAWPASAVPAATAIVWYDHLRDITPAEGLEAARRVIDQDDRFPSFARYRSVARVVRREHEARSARERGLPAPPRDRDLDRKGQEWARSLRAALQGGGGGGGVG